MIRKKKKIKIFKKKKKKIEKQISTTKMRKNQNMKEFLNFWIKIIEEEQEQMM